MKILIITIVSFTISVPLCAQKYYKTYYNKEGRETVEDSAFYFEEGHSENYRQFGQLSQFYTSNNQLKTQISHDSIGRRNGKVMSFFENGNLEKKSFYKNGRKIGPEEHYYANSEPKEVRLYDTAKNDSPFQISYKLMSFWDSLGNQTVIDGNGYYHSYIYPNSKKTEAGSFANGSKTGEWKGFYGNGNFFFNEVYEDGNLIEGKSMSKDSIGYTYTKLDEQPEPKNGMRGFYRYVGKGIKYPKSARKKGIQGRVFVQFIVDKKGRLTEVKTLKGISTDCNGEAERIIRESATWKSGFQRGIPVKVKMILPVTFKLS